MTQVGFKQFRHEGCNSYLISDPASKQTALIDPVAAQMDEYREWIADHALKLTWVLETHTHADHISASYQLRSETQCEIGLSQHTKSERVTKKLADHQTIQIGAIEVQALETPGHTPDSMCYLIPAIHSVFTGDTLLISSSGRTDFPGASAEAQFRSLHEVLGALPEATLVFPGHEYNDRLFSTIGAEIKNNPHWAIGNAKSFAQMKNAELISAVGQDILRTVQQNLAAIPDAASLAVSSPTTTCGLASKSTDEFAAISVDKYSAKLRAKDPQYAFIDVREPAEFKEGHMPGAINIPLSEVAFSLDELAKVSRVYLSCQSGRRSSFAAKTLMYVGFRDVVNVVGGIRAWTQAGLPVES